MEPFIGEIRLLPYTSVPFGWAPCDGQLLSIANSLTQPLFSVIGTTYGGDGKSNFALPNLKGCVAPGAGRGPDLENWHLGEKRGQNSIKLTSGEMPRHTHGMNGLDIPGNAGAPSAGAYLGQDRRGGQGNLRFLTPSATESDITLASEALTSAGKNQSHENRQPFLSLNFCIALIGIWPPRS